jgi:hypothetical protein
VEHCGCLVCPVTCKPGGARSPASLDCSRQFTIQLFPRHESSQKTTPSLTTNVSPLDSDPLRHSLAPNLFGPSACTPAAWAQGWVPVLTATLVSPVSPVLGSITIKSPCYCGFANHDRQDDIHRSLKTVISCDGDKPRRKPNGHFIDS